MAPSSDATASNTSTPSDPESTESGSAADEPVRRGRVRLRRAAVMAVPATAIAAGLMILTAQGALGVQFAISGMPFTVTATELKGTGFEQFGGLDYMAEGSPNAGDTGGEVWSSPPRSRARPSPSCARASTWAVRTCSSRRAAARRRCRRAT